MDELGFGSDGSAFYRFVSSEVNGVFDAFGGIEVVEELSDKFIWVNSLGVAKEVPSDIGEPLENGVAKVVTVTDNRLVVEVEKADPEDPPLEVLIDFRRNAFNDQLTEPSTITIVGQVLTAPNYTKVGDDKFFYTLEQLGGGGKLLSEQRESSYDGAGSNGSFAGGTGYAIGDAITLSDDSIITVINTSAVAPIDAQDQDDYDGVAP